MTDKIKIKRALVSVSDKTGIVDVCKTLDKLGVEIISTGGTLKALREAEIHVVSVSTFTGSPEILGGRVKTLHPKVHAGILYRRGNPEDEEQMQQAEFKGIDLVIVNLYPFKQTVAKPNVTEEEIIENIDIGGPSMVRSAAKNFESVAIVSDPSDYAALADQLKANKGATTLAFRRMCAGKAYALTADYDAAVSGYFVRTAPVSSSGPVELFPQCLVLQYDRTSSLRYGENPHQSASLYEDRSYPAPTLLKAQILAGKELSYNNYGDLDACLDMLLEFTEPFACVLKHANPCGAAVGDTIADAYKAAYESDPLSAYGSIIGLNKTVDMKCAELLHETPFVECILAPRFDDEALALLTKKKTRRLLALPQISEGRVAGLPAYKFIRGGLLAQNADDAETTMAQLQVVTKRQPTPDEIRSLLFAWKVVKHTKSNAIVLARGVATVGIGMGQTSRVDSAFMAVKRAGERSKGSVMASDAFFPMTDGLLTGTDAGVTAVIQPGGSKGDPEVIAAADTAGIAMVFTGIRHFKH
ncbi:bifunctional phosphoribosylaminoimidazolecarboxamide formyltransferase/inosine monophosphate cyclohydrolase [candidate division GN15 bacterium]|uniref:Bifunctional purine biosynthesis protein PurH n=1 Tax=candidate division GN15 bacterium TaxID=2072418 RepID=A0A855X728_9BACT|nr:MAG: bifunctional phosphoribosylaminoimidazolecarboxamide formyltransferase/inosine monophosphate cyclohydrolase [candidate division GN15 bacterium]